MRSRETSWRGSSGGDNSARLGYLARVTLLDLVYTALAPAATAAPIHRRPRLANAPSRQLFPDDDVKRCCRGNDSLASASMSSATLHVAAPRHGPNDRDHPLVYPGSDIDSSSSDASPRPSNAPSAYAAISRAVAGALAFMFKRPVRLFRPVKSAFARSWCSPASPKLTSIHFRSLDMGRYPSNSGGTGKKRYAGLCARSAAEGRRESRYLAALLSQLVLRTRSDSQRGIKVIMQIRRLSADIVLPWQWRFFPKHVLPPLAINATIGMTLFTAYTVSLTF
jgi:hypothetical protein